jgi:hypothetical protein
MHHLQAFQHPTITRRTAVQAGAISLLGLGMNHVAALRAMASGSGTRAPTARAVIYIFLSGGLSQLDSFDLKPDAPEAVRGEFRPMATRTAGVQISEHLPLLAARSHLWALCRSLTHPSNDHSASHLIMLTGRSQLPVGFDPAHPKPTDWPSIAAVAGRASVPRNNLPPAIILPELLVHREGRVIPGQLAGEMGSHWDPWVVQASPYNPTSYGAYPEFGFHHERGAENPKTLAFQAPDLRLPEGLTRPRMADRVGLLNIIEGQVWNLEHQAELVGFSHYREQAVSLLSATRIRDAFDVVHADARTQERYGRNSFGRSLLMARRLVEAGVNLVQVNLGNNETWDTHQSAFPNLKNFLFPPTDRAVSALLDDLQATGLLDSTLVVMAGEFGRTPRISTLPGAKLPGRDHWGAVQTVFFAGSGVRGGRVIGSSDKNGAFPATDPQTPENLAATIYRALGLPGTTAWRDPAGRPHFIYQGEPIAGLM